MTKIDFTTVKNLYVNNRLSQKQIADIFKVSQMTICKLLNKNYIQCRSSRKYSYDDTIFDKISDHDEDKLHFIGFFIADGSHSEKSNRLTLGIHKKDIDILQKYNTFIYNNTYNIRNCKSKNGIYHGVIFNIFGKKISRRFIELGIRQNKTFTASLPKIQFTEQMFRFFIKGLFDGDGSFTFKTGNPQVSANIDIACSETLCDQIINEMLKYGFVLRKRKHKSNICYIRLSGMDKCYNFLNWLYHESTIHLNRKYKTYVSFCEFMKTYTSRRFEGNRKRKVYMYDSNYNLNHTFNRLKDAARFIKCDSGWLSKKITNKKLYKGFYWSFNVIN